jgi:hypothetical protein
LKQKSQESSQNLDRFELDASPADRRPVNQREFWPIMGIFVQRFVLGQPPNGLSRGGETRATVRVANALQATVFAQFECQLHLDTCVSPFDNCS